MALFRGGKVSTNAKWVISERWHSKLEKIKDETASTPFLPMCIAKVCSATHVMDQKQTFPQVLQLTKVVCSRPQTLVLILLKLNVC